MCNGPTVIHWFTLCAQTYGLRPNCDAPPKRTSSELHYFLSSTMTPRRSDPEQPRMPSSSHSIEEEEKVFVEDESESEGDSLAKTGSESDLSDTEEAKKQRALVWKETKAVKRAKLFVFAALILVAVLGAFVTAILVQRQENDTFHIEVSLKHSHRLEKPMPFSEFLTVAWLYVVYWICATGGRHGQSRWFDDLCYSGRLWQELDVLCH